VQYSDKSRFTLIKNNDPNVIIITYTISAQILDLTLRTVWYS